jgi:glycosyltransferase involved in cell wall biosynthesis
VCTVHNSFGSFSLPNRMLLLPMFAAFRRVVLCSRAALDSFPAPWRALGGNRVAVIPNGVDTGRVDRELSTIPPRRLDTPFRVVSVGRLIPRKDPLTLLRAFLVSRLPGDELVFIGGGPKVWAAYAKFVRHWDVTRLPYDGEADRYFDPAWLCGG